MQENDNLSGMPAIGLADWLGKRAQASPRRNALTFEGETWTYRELMDRVERAAGVLAAAGTKAGDRVGFLAFNHPLFFVTMFAAARIGAIFVPLNFRLAPAELEFIINDSGMHTLVAGKDHYAVIDGLRASISCTTYVCESAVDGWQDLSAAMAGAEPPAPRVARADELAIIMYTSGTTGKPKGVMLSHGNLWWNNINALLNSDMASDDVTLAYAPLFHIAGLNGPTMVTLMKGGHVILHKSFDPERFLKDVATYRVTMTFAVPAMLLFVSQHPGFAEADLSSFRLIIVGGAPVPLPLLTLLREKGVPVQQGYGLTETAPMATFLAADRSFDKLGSAGQPPLLTDIRLLDADGTVITQANAVGEICIRGPNVMKGYWNRPDATAQVLSPDGWFRSGDAGYVDEEGFLYIADRLKDMIISGGENIYPAEVESVLYQHPAIAEVAVIGVPDEKWGESVAAIVALKRDMQLSLEELQAFAGERLARYKIPRILHCTDALPRTGAGKVLKHQLRSAFAKK